MTGSTVTPPPVQETPRERIKRARPATVLAVACAVFVLGVLVGASVASDTQLIRMSSVLVLALFATATNLVLGQGGLLPFGQGAMYGAGAYTIGLLWLHLEVPFWPGFLVAPFVGAFVALATGALALRARGLYFSFVTLAFSQLAFTMVVKFDTFTQGENGIVGTMIPSYLIDPTNAFLVTAAITGVCLVALWAVFRSPFGTSLRAIRENRERVEALGVNVYRHQLVMYVIAGGFSGVAGALAFMNGRVASPEMTDWTTSAVPVVAAVLGGMFNFAGPLLGAFIYSYGRDLLLPYTSHWQLIFGLALLTIVLFRPGGLFQRRAT